MPDSPDGAAEKMGVVDPARQKVLVDAARSVLQRVSSASGESSSSKKVRAYESLRD